LGKIPEKLGKTSENMGTIPENIGLNQWFPKWAVPPPWGRWETLGWRWSRNGRLGATGDPVNNYISVVLL